jgi:hypothetical protein
MFAGVAGKGCLCNGAKAGAKQWECLLVPQERAVMWASPQKQFKTFSMLEI